MVILSLRPQLRCSSGNKPMECADMPGPLAGIRVLDLTSVVSGPLATMFLADQGAEVIKIEPLGGDITRRSRQSISASGEFSALFVSSNRGKRSLALDLKRPEAAKIMRKLVAGSDVLVRTSGRGRWNG